MNYILEIESKNKSEAQKRAADLLGIPEDELDFETEGAGLLGMMARKPVVVRVRAKNDPGDQALITGVLLTLMHKMGIEADIEDFEDTEENYIIHVESEDSGILIGRQGKTLDALQFLLKERGLGDIPQESLNRGIHLSGGCFSCLFTGLSRDFLRDMVLRNEET